MFPRALPRTLRLAPLAGAVVLLGACATAGKGPTPQANQLYAQLDQASKGYETALAQARAGNTQASQQTLDASLDQLADMIGLAIERCEMAEEMAYQASHDGLTGLANRTMFMERLEEAMQHGPGGCLFVSRLVGTFHLAGDLTFTND